MKITSRNYNYDKVEIIFSKGVGLSQVGLVGLVGWVGWGVGAGGRVGMWEGGRTGGRVCVCGWDGARPFREWSPEWCLT